MVYQITISGLVGTEPSGKPSMKRENCLPSIGFRPDTFTLGAMRTEVRQYKLGRNGDMIGQMLSEATGSYRPEAELHDRSLPEGGAYADP